MGKGRGKVEEKRYINKYSPMGKEAQRPIEIVLGTFNMSLVHGITKVAPPPLLYSCGNSNPTGFSIPRVGYEWIFLLI